MKCKSFRHNQLLMILSLLKLGCSAKFTKMSTSSNRHKINIKHKTPTYLRQSSMHATSFNSLLQISHGSESEENVEKPNKLSDPDEMAVSKKNIQRLSGTSTRFAPAACSGRRFPWEHRRGAVGPASVWQGKSAFFLRSHCTNLFTWI